MALCSVQYSAKVQKYTYSVLPAVMKVLAPKKLIRNLSDCSWLFLKYLGAFHIFKPGKRNNARPQLPSSAL